MPSTNLISENKFADYIAQGLAEYLKLTSGKVEGDKIYKFSLKIWFDIDKDNINQVSITDVNFNTLNKSLNKKYRKVANE